MSKTTKTPFKKHQSPLILHDAALETHRSWTTFQVGRNLMYHDASGVEGVNVKKVKKVKKMKKGKNGRKNFNNRFSQ